MVPREHPQNEHGTEGALDGDPDTFWSAPAGSHSASLGVDFGTPITIDRALIMERLNNGQHVQSYRIDAWNDGRWEPLAAGSSIGHKRIESFAPRKASRVRLAILSSSDAAEIREFRVFAAEEKAKTAAQ